MRPSLWTAMFLELDPCTVLTHIAQIGWPSAELSDEHLIALCESPDLEQSAAQFREAAAAAQLAVPQAHLFLIANVADPNTEKRRGDIATIKRQIDFCQLAGITVGVIHPGGLEYVEWDAWQQAQAVRAESFRELADYAGERGVRLAVENMNDRVGAGLGPRRRFGAEPWELLELLEAVNSPVMGVCLDTSHANIQGLDQPRLIRQMGELLIAVHISDNDGLADRHWIPLRGNIDWPPIVAALNGIGFVGDFNLEIPGARHCPPEFFDARARYALEVTERLLGA